jgi:DNA-binding NarL/FixJ family response regulator
MNSQPNKRKGKVFLVDDHPLVREWLGNLIQQQADLVVCGESESASQALAAIGACKPDVAIVDISLKDSSGIELIKSLKASYPKVQALVLSMHEEFHYAEQALRAGARGYVVKRETANEVILAIRRILEGKRFVSASLAEAMTASLTEGKKQTNRSPAEQLSDQELKVFDLLGQGLSTRQIAERLRIGPKTVQCYCARMKEKLNLNSGTELLREAIRWNNSRYPS